MTRRVVVTGMGMINGMGHDLPSVWAAALAGCSGVGLITALDTKNTPVKVAAEVKNWQPEHILDARTARRSDRYQQFVMVATAEALRQSGLPITDANRARVSVMIGAATGGFLTYDENMRILNEQGARRITPFGIMMVVNNGATAMISIEYGAQGPSHAVISSCATGADNIGHAFRLIQHGEADAAIAGAGESPITEMGIACLDRINTLSHVSDPPESACAPFDQARSGLVLGEGAGILILEALEHAQARGAHILAEIVGYGASMDGYHISAPDENATGAILAMRRALTDAKLAPDEIDHINTHGAATKLGDLVEVRALKGVFGDRATEIPMNATKPMTGHAMGATSAFEALFCINAIRDGAIPPTLNLNQRDTEFPIDLTPFVTRRKRIHTAMSNSLGLGGHNASLIFREYQP
jgi:beta-ketoacyl-acyl-carrier-protein synthase II